ncbi:MAG: pilus assembly protein [Isosphaeraceae bacterium]|nr:pilus assembly protein [Isosphaeraceae bacterium]
MRVPHRRERQRRGGAVVETAAVMPIIIALVFGQIEFARLGMASQMLTIAAREGCRVAVLDFDPSTGAPVDLSAVQKQINNYLIGASIPQNQIPTLTAVDGDPGTVGAWIMPSNWSTCSMGTPITVVLRIPYAQISWLPNPTYLQSANVTGSASINSEHVPSS